MFFNSAVFASTTNRYFQKDPQKIPAAANYTLEKQDYCSAYLSAFTGEGKRLIGCEMHANDYNLVAVIKYGPVSCGTPCESTGEFIIGNKVDLVCPAADPTKTFFSFSAETGGTCTGPPDCSDKTDTTNSYAQCGMISHASSCTPSEGCAEISISWVDNPGTLNLNG